MGISDRQAEKDLLAHPKLYAKYDVFKKRKRKKRSLMKFMTGPTGSASIGAVGGASLGGPIGAGIGAGVGYAFGKLKFKKKKRRK